MKRTIFGILLFAIVILIFGTFGGIEQDRIDAAAGAVAIIGELLAAAGIGFFLRLEDNRRR